MKTLKKKSHVKNLAPGFQIWNDSGLGLNREKKEMHKEKQIGLSNFKSQML